ncbi:MAG: pyridoxal phosphate-dependent aminotransferase [Deltaproteobacteria bacterium]|nr:pyridoxal phosphate-dependent aminotransferase [Deltaproteobacteria bacterium]
MEIHPDIRRIPYGDRKRIQDAAEGREDLVNLASGNPDLPMPPFIRDRLKAGFDAGRAPYTNYYGLPELRRRLALSLKEERNITADPEKDLLITHGVQEGLYVVMKSVILPGDEILIPSPHYAEYYLNTVACGGIPVLVPLDEGNGFVPELDRMERAVTPKTRALVFCNPNNPLGVVWSRQVLEGIADLAHRHDLVVLVDEIYRDFTYTEPPPSIITMPGMKERTFVFGGFSKSYMMMGLRVGYVVGPAEAMFPIKNLHYCVTLCPSSPGQIAALAALDCPKDQLQPIYKEFEERLEILYRGVKAIPGVSCVEPKGSFYIFPNMKCFGLGSMDLALRLIEEARVVTLPGTEFGPYGEGYLRLSTCASREEIEKGVGRLREFAETFLTRKEGEERNATRCR